MRVIALSQGYDNVKLREPGEEFEMPDGSTGSWFYDPEAKVEDAKPKGKHKAQKAEPIKSGVPEGADSDLA